MTYVDGFVLPVLKKNLMAYRKMAQAAEKVWRRHGALDYKECVAEDVKIKGVIPFTRLAKCKPGETVVFAYIVYKSRAHRDKVNASVMAYFNKKYKDKPMPCPFDVKRMAYSGFRTIVGK
jgi:uncharacterized protein YbaA (DUF1428 family)